MFERLSVGQVFLYCGLSFSQLFKHINLNIRHNRHNLKLTYQLPNQFC